MALAAEVYAGVKALEDQRKDLNHAILTKNEQIAKLQEEVATAQATFDGVSADLSAALDRAGVVRKTDAYLVFSDEAKSVLFRTQDEATAIRAAGGDPNDAAVPVPVKV